MTECLYILSGLVVGIVLTIVVCFIAYRKLYVGCIHMDASDPDERPYLFLDLNREPEMLAKKSFVVCKVDPVDISKQVDH